MGSVLTSTSITQRVTLDSRLFANRKAHVLWFTLPEPSPVPTSGVDADLVTPGVWGFVITFLLVVAVVLLIIDMTRRIRRVTHRAQVKEALAAEEAAEKPAAEKPAAEKPVD